MFYSEGFKEKARKELPDDEELHRLVDEGDEGVGQYLTNSIIEMLTCDNILNDTCDDAEKIGKEVNIRAKLYVEWNKQKNCNE